jgi:hypothetical protein
MEEFVFTLDLARAHIHDLHRAAARSHRNAAASAAHPSRLRRIVGRGRAGR